MKLEDCWLFEALSEPTRKSAAALATEESHPKGDFLFRAEDPAEHFYLLCTGRVRLVIGTDRHITSIVSNPGEMLGWSSMVDRETYTAAAECLEPVTVLKFGAADLIQLLQSAPADGLIFYRRLAQLIGARLASTLAAALSLYGERSHKYWG